jgi:hypothetical protein
VLAPVVLAHSRGRRSPRRAAGAAYYEDDPSDQAGHREWMTSTHEPSGLRGADCEDLADKLTSGHLPVSFMWYCLRKRARCLL